MVVGELLALLVMVTLPEELPAAEGSKMAEKEVDCPALKVKGNASPVTEKPVPLTVSDASDTLALPVFVNVTVFVALVPVVTLPKFKELGEADTCRVCATPVPDNATDNEGVAELFVSVSAPETEPAALGSKLTVQDELPPGKIVSGSVSPE